MRYSVRYECGSKRWAVLDGQMGNKVLATHDSKGAAYDQAYIEENKQPNNHADVRRLTQLRSLLSRNAVLG
ncbi:MAG: hypothetical protein O3A84_06115 [Proteobacteria bacterium]|nr:hypothetical protein [Pseudomonadota bacterium]